MDPFTPDRTSYTTNDFVLWNEHKILLLSPKFQRRPVWSSAARSYLIDTILRGMTVPPLYLRITQDSTTKKTVREVVDGQQRMRSVLDFLDDGYRLSRTLNAPWAGKYFSDLGEDEQEQIRAFSFSAEVFKGISDQQVREVFCRLNMNGVPLNKQELRNGRYFGLFKQAAWKLANDHLEFWRRNRLFTEQSIARMLEVEMTSELLIAGLAGMQDKKLSIEDFYRDYDERYASEATDTKRFRETTSVISEAFNGDLAQSAFRRPPLFYTLYCVVYHRMFGMPGITRKSPKKRLSTDERSELNEAVIRLSEIIAIAKEDDPDNPVPKRYAGFVAACLRQTDNIHPRKVRFDTLYDEAF